MKRVALCALVAAGVLFWAPAASAHANLASSDPSAGTTVQSAPASVTLHFTERPEIALSQVQVLKPDGTRVDQGALQPLSGDAKAMRVPLKKIGKGVYTVAWRTVSKDDGHATAGSFAFGVGVSAANAKPPASVVAKSPLPSPLEVVARWLIIAGLVAAFGGALIALVALGDATATVRNYVLAGAALAFIGVILLAIGERNDAGVALSVLLKTSVGHALERRLVAVGATLVAAFAATRVRVALAVAAIFAATAMLAEVSAGHAAAGSIPALQIGAQWLHFAAAAAWMGGLAALLLGIRGEASDVKARAVRRFSAIAGVAIFAVAGTGTLRAVYQIQSWRGLFTSGYGIFVLIKSALFVALAVLGATNRYRNIPKVDRDLAPLRRAGHTEVTVAVAVLIATAVLTGLSPPPPSALAADSSISVSGSDLGRTFHVELEIAPGFSGPNMFTARVADLETGKPFTSGTVTLRFDFKGNEPIGTSELTLEGHGDVWSANGSNLSLEGRYEVTVTAQGATNSAEVPLELATRCRTTVLSAGSPGQPTIYTEPVASGTVQTYVDPGKAGPNEVHFTFFNAKGNELDVPKKPTIDAWRPGRQPMTLKVRRFSAGHFIARGSLTKGLWRFETSVKPKGSTESVAACFEETIT